MSPADKFFDFFREKRISFEQVRTFVVGYYGWFYGLGGPVVFILATCFCLYKDDRECWQMVRSASTGGDSYIFVSPNMDSPALDKTYYTKHCRNDGNVFTAMDTEYRFLKSFPRIYNASIHEVNKSYVAEPNSYYAKLAPHDFQKDAPLKLVMQCLVQLMPFFFCLRKSARLLKHFSSQKESAKRESKGEVEAFMAISTSWDALSWTETTNYLSSYFEFLRYLVFCDILVWIYNWFLYGDWWVMCPHYYLIGNYDALDQVFFPEKEYCFFGRQEESNVVECTSDMYYYYRYIFLFYYSFLTSAVVIGSGYLLLQCLTWKIKVLAVWRVLRKHESDLRDENPVGLRKALEKLPPGHLMVLAALDDFLEPRVYRQLLAHISTTWKYNDYKKPPHKKNTVKFWLE